ncbi:hypothetical protein B0H14DRAFT_2572667 [Mycena olivaceomarginata]|nr:hypothetical protein B0H14DRAFT_2618203 [Mycena olivaceomarginata]KAJ7867944.1 hypothetical protein B0H14DRAFT_2572667 [Mycena olivaceomarginata]
MEAFSLIEDFITVKYKVLREVPGKDKGVLNLVEGNPNIKADATPLSLRVSGIKTMEAKIFSALEGFPINWDRIVLREISNFTRASPLPYFMRVALTGKPRGKDGAPTFKKPTKPFELGLYIDFDQWEGIERYLTQKEIDKEARTQDSHLGSLNPTTNLKPSPPQTPIIGVPFRLTSLRTVINYGMHWPKAALLFRCFRGNKQVQGLFVHPLLNADIALTISDRVEFFPISYRPLNELIAAVGGGKFQGFTCDLGKAAQGSIVMEKDNYLGIGTFKTAHPAYLTLMHLTSEGLGTKPNEAVAVKRMYRTNIAKFLWRPIFCTVAIVHEQPSGRTQYQVNNLPLISSEELIDEKLDGFHKFIHNGNAVSALSDSEDSHFMRWRISCFTQHVQYYKTAGMVYLSDLQGTLERLTDPQIMTSPSIGDGIDLFGMEMCQLHLQPSLQSMLATNSVHGLNYRNQMPTMPRHDPTFKYASTCKSYAYGPMKYAQSMWISETSLA